MTPDRDETIRIIRKALRQRSGKAWSVTGGRGTAWGWITITAPPARSTGYGSMTDTDREELSQLLGEPVHHQGASVPSGGNYYAEYIARAKGETPSVYGVQYWD